MAEKLYTRFEWKIEGSKKVFEKTIYTPSVLPYNEFVEYLQSIGAKDIHATSTH